MSNLRPLQPGDLEQVAELFVAVARPGGDESVPEIARYFERTTLLHPWADPELPSLVMVDDRGRIAGFVGCYVVRMRLDGDRIRAVCPGNLVATPHARGFPPGALLLRELMNGPQDVTFVDTLGARSRAMWEALGGETASLGALSWVRIFRPFGLARQRIIATKRAEGAGRIAASLDAAFHGIARRVKPDVLTTAPPTRAEPLDAGTMMRALPDMTAGLRLHPDYEQPYLGWLLDELARPRRRGSLVGRVVRDGDRVLGWYLYYLKRGGLSRALQVMAGERHLGAVLDHLLHDADAGGAAAIEGRLEPRLLKPLSSRRCVFRHTGAFGIHTSNRDIVEAALSRHSAFTRADSEYWPVPPRGVKSAP